MKRSPHQQCKEPVCFMLNGTPLVILDSEVPSSHVRLAFHLYFIHAVVGASDCKVLTVLWFTPIIASGNLCVPGMLLPADVQARLDESPFVQTKGLYVPRLSAFSSILP